MEANVHGCPWVFMAAHFLLTIPNLTMDQAMGMARYGKYKIKDLTKRQSISKNEMPF